MAEVRERGKTIKQNIVGNLSNRFHTPVALKAQQKHPHTIITLQICHRSTHLKTFLAQKRYFVQHQTTCLAVMNITSMFL